MQFRMCLSDRQKITWKVYTRSEADCKLPAFKQHWKNSWDKCIENKASGIYMCRSCLWNKLVENVKEGINTYYIVPLVFVVFCSLPPTTLDVVIMFPFAVSEQTPLCRWLSGVFHWSWFPLLNSVDFYYQKHQHQEQQNNTTHRLVEESFKG